jgi:hypothetical protein
MQHYLVVSEWMFVWALALFLLNIMICISPMCSSQEKKLCNVISHLLPPVFFMLYHS